MQARIGDIHTTMHRYWNELLDCVLDPQNRLNHPQQTPVPESAHSSDALRVKCYSSCVHVSSFSVLFVSAIACMNVARDVLDVYNAHCVGMADK